MRRNAFVLTGVLVVAVAGGVYFVRQNPAAIGWPTIAAVASPPPFAMPVPVAKVVKKTIAITLDYPGRTDAIQSVTLQAKVSGYVVEQAAPDGSEVKKGDVLYRIDPRDYQAAVDLANAQVQRDEAALDYARSNAARGVELSHDGNLAKDTQEQRASAARQAEATLAMDQAAVRAARLNLDYTTILAPFDGRLGRNQAPIGALIGAGAGGLNTLVQLDPLYVTFNPSESDLARIQDAQGKGTLEASVFLPGSDAEPHKGKLTFLDNAVDRATGTITARVTIENAGGAWRPGQYVRVSLLLGEQPDALEAPQVAMGSSQLGKYLYVVGKDNKVEQQFVTLGSTDGDAVVISGKIAEGDQIVTGNLQKIGPGALVRPLMQ